MALNKNDLTIIIKPTHNCNLGCKYCYLDSHAEQGNMNHNLLVNMTEQLIALENKDCLHFLWHGGEPLLMGVDFYREAIDIQKRLNKSGKIIRNSMQSNCTLITPELLEFCEENDIFIGCSLDGPEEINNLTRMYPDGRGAFQDAWAGICAINKKNDEIKQKTPKGKVANRVGGGVIVVLNRLNIDRVDEIYSFFKSENISPNFNAIIKSGQATKNYHELGIRSDEYGKAMISIFDRWYNEKEEGIGVWPFQEIMTSLLYKEVTMCNHSGNCRNNFIAIGPMGDVYPCGRFDGIQEYRLGNIVNSRLPEILNSDLHRSMEHRNTDKITGCNKCSYADVCNGGCMHDSLMHNGSLSGKDYYCASHKILFSHIDKRIAPDIANADVV